MMCEHEFESLRTADGSFCMSACRKCMKSTGEIETLFKAETRIAAANARIAELEGKLTSHGPDGHQYSNQQFIDMRLAKEKAEAQCAAMRLRFEKYVRENCKLIRHSVADGLEKPDDVEGKCGGYCQNFDEPHYLCQECVAAYDPDAEYNEEIADAGTAIHTRLHRMEVALREIVNVTSKCLSHEEMKDKMKHIAKAALEEKP